ncbi:hypothetical protein AYO40_03705 [Planctomycetaceae bacterium SCGC AG-212-D15]|nr:hypothetical protein AYO40_03705 [Planctomycetaceae bacterium SCGC AG-212-D15]
MDFALLLLVNAVLFVRPGEISSALSSWPIYQVLIIVCAAVSYGALCEQLSWDALRRSPISLCVVLLWLAAVLSHLAQLALEPAWDIAVEFGKVIVFYLLLVGLVNSTQRLRQFLRVLLLLILVVAAIGMLEYHGLVEIPGLTTLQERHWNDAAGEWDVYARVRATGIFNDPNDLSLILSLGFFLSLYCLGDRDLGTGRILGLPAMALFLYALKLTQSRGGLLGLLAGCVMLMRTRYGWKKTLLLSAVVVPVIVVAFGGRQTNFDISSTDDTGQHRIQLWAEGMTELRTAPLFGIGANTYQERCGLVAHNSYVHGYTELGLVGGALFVSAFYFALWPLERLCGRTHAWPDDELRRLHPYLLAIVTAYAVGLLSLSRNYVIPTYLVLGLVCCFLNLAVRARTVSQREITFRLWPRIITVGGSTLMALYVGIQLLVRWS